MPEVIAFYDPGSDITCQASAGLTGGRLVGIPSAVNAGGGAGISDTGDGNAVVGLPTAGGWCLGVASHDAATGGKVNVMRSPKVVPVEVGAGNSGVIAVGAEVMADNTGCVLTLAVGADIHPVGRHIGPATTAAGQYAKVLLYNMGATKNA